MKILGTYYPDETDLWTIFKDLNSRGIYNYSLVQRLYDEAKEQMIFGGDAQLFIDSVSTEKEPTAEELIQEVIYGA